MTEEFHKPTKFAGAKFESMHGGDDPAAISRVAHESAHALLRRVRDSDEPGVIDRIVEYTDLHGIDAVAELWSRASPRSLPGALWRLYLVRAMIRSDAESTSFYFQRGTEVSVTIDAVVAGASAPTGPTEIVSLADEILRGVFSGDFAIALDRAAAFCRITSAGCTSVADDVDAITPDRATELTTRALRLTKTASELTACARLWRSDGLD
ncbi:DNA-directed RNA polymerase subunit beta [Planctomonas psychrotolerans]|uniref:DNA-directed RNA polymerase subunit beta n=1 Tax=Planctomonas psychrotolerans TaxID=2528712 RepID=UPI00123B90D8|nr:DNA-directed RNA polymerase subunit beta [Planctomonas psychrotolerans]